MGTKRVGLARVEALIENLKRDLALDGSALHHKKPVSSPTGTTTVLTAADSGKTIFMDASSANTITLPAVGGTTAPAGWHVKVVLTATGALGKIVTSSSENKILGQVVAIDADGSATAVTNDADADTISFVNGCLPGAWVEIVSNGSLFFVHGFGTHATASNKLTLTQVSG